MKKVFFIFTVVISLIIIANLLGQGFTYVGAQKCKICHQSEKQGLQFPTWEKSNHSQSFIALSSEKAQSIAKEIGLQNPAESPKCLICHAPLFEKAPEIEAEGVTCEVCHGPGSEYKKLNIMKDKELAIKNGLFVYGSVEAIKNHCANCHENAHEKSFDFASSWEKIKHPIPEKK